MSNRTHVVLKRAFERVQKQNAKFSIRALALKVGVSHVFMHKLLRGTAKLPSDKIAKLVKALSLDELSQGELREAIVYDSIKESLDAFPGLKSKKKLTAETFEEYPAKFYSILDKWYDLVILDLLTCQLPDKSPKALAKMLGLSFMEVEMSLEKAARLGLARFSEGEWLKVNTNIRLPTSGAAEITRNYYLQVLEKIAQELSRRSEAHFARRSITNLSIAVDPSKVPEAKQRLQQTLYDIAKDLSQGTPTEVFHLTLALVPVSDR